MMQSGTTFHPLPYPYQANGYMLNIYASETTITMNNNTGTPFNTKNVLVLLKYTKTIDTPTTLSMIPAMVQEPGDSTIQTMSQKAITDSIETMIQIANHIYPGVNLTVKFAAEISRYTSPWAWIKDRINAVNFSGINVGDYIPLTLTDGKNFKMEVAGIDTYYNYGNTPIGHHIDFTSRDCHPDLMLVNQVNYNNGTTVSTSPWLASRLYAQLNSLKMNVPNATTANPTLATVDYTTTGVLDKIPADIANLIVTKRVLLPSRYTSGSLLTDDNNYEWRESGKLWIPFEVEVYGHKVWGSSNTGYSIGCFIQYPIFAQKMKIIKCAGEGGSRSNWWLGSTKGASSSAFAHVGDNGTPASTPAANSPVRVPICFRIA